MNTLVKALVSGAVFASFAAPSSSSALIGKALELDGVDDFAETPDAPTLHMGDELSVTGWLRVDDFSGGTYGWQNIFWKGNAPDHGPHDMREYSLHLNNGGYLLLGSTPTSRIGVGYLNVRTPVAQIEPGEWFHFAAIISAPQNFIQIYINGQLQASGAFDSSFMRDTGGPLRLGGLPDRDFFGGLIDELQVWNRALSAGEVEKSMNRTPTGLERGLVAYYDFDELDAYGAVPDRSGRGHRLQLRNGARLVGSTASRPPLARLDIEQGTARDLFVRSLKLDGQGDYLEIPDAPGLHPGSSLTIEGWIRPERLVSGWQGIFFKGAAPHSAPFPNLEYSLWLRPDGYLHSASTPQGAGGRLALDSAGPVIQVGAWQHVAAVVDGAKGFMRIYVNGSLKAERAYGVGAIKWAGANLTLGRGNDQADFSGQIDEVRLWNKALSAGEIDHNMRRGIDGTEEGLVAHYSFDQIGPDGLVPDLSGFGHHGHLRGDAFLSSEHLVQTLVPGRIHGEAADLVIMALKHHDSGVRRRAVKGLEKVGPYDFNRVMDVALKHHDAWVRRHAASVLAHAELSALPAGKRDHALVIALNHWDADVRRRAVEALDRGSLDDMTTAMKVALGHHDPLVRRRAADILARAEYGGVPVELAEAGHRYEQPHKPDWSPDGYRGWEHRWAAPRTTLWNLEPEGLMGRYNRVEGGYLAWHLPRNYHPGAGLANYGEVGYSLGLEEFSYRAGAEVFSFYNPANARDNLVTIGGELHDLTDTQDRWLITDEENSADAALFRRDYRDYYRRTGWSVYTAHNFGGALQVTGRYNWDEFASLENSSNWVVFSNRFTRSAFRPNPPVDEIQVRSLRADIQLDTRNNRYHPHQGWFANALFERAGGVLDGDAEFKRYLGDVRRYQPVGRGTRVDLRLRMGTAKGRLPSQYLYDLGGLSTLRGYGFKEFSGDRMVLFNAEYWIDGDAHWRHGEMPIDDMALGVFFDAGSAWFAADAQNPFDRFDYLVSQPGQFEDQLNLKKSFGFGIELGDTRVNIARALDGVGRDWEFSARFGRTF